MNQARKTPFLRRNPGNRTRHRLLGAALASSLPLGFAGCSGDIGAGDTTGGPVAPVASGGEFSSTGGTSATTGGTSATTGGTSATTGGTPATTGGTPATTGGAPPASGGTSTGGAPAGGVGGVTGPASCSEAASAYTVTSTPIDVSAMLASGDGFGSERYAVLSVAVNPADGQAYVGFTDDANNAVIAGPGGVIVSIPEAVNAGIAITSDGVAALLFDPNSNVDDRVWAAVARYGWDGTELFRTELFHSPNLVDVGTKGAPATSRFGYLPDSDQLVAYFSHTQRYDDDVRHQGGYLAYVDGSGTQDLMSGWWGSHNLDQRLLVDGSEPAVLGLGDAYPEGIFFSFLDGNPQTDVIYPLASSGNGATNGQLGGLVDLDDEVIVPFITNNSVPQDLDAGTWPDIDDTIAQQIRDAAANGTDLGLLRVPKGSNPDELEATWVASGLAEGARLQRLKSARYGTGGLILLAWAEATGSGRNGSIAGYYTMVVDRDGAECQPKTPLDAGFAFTGGDDFVRGPDGAIFWANAEGGALKIMRLAPE